MRLRTAASADLDRALPHIADFHLHEQLATTPEGRRSAVARLLAEPGRGGVVLAEEEDQVIGYGVYVFGYSIEFGGIDAFADELYVVASHRGQGIGTALLEAMAKEAGRGGARAMHLEVDIGNPRALELYKRLGFGVHNRRLMTKSLG
ncbi:MAG TPA: GNAT family N-acetyltransferase [Candidatus Thermoplasmatota archaeon]|nr:GNAT family N-acetyltransferase [Candidatus Thermoplasmatota archaeon]